MMKKEREEFMKENVTKRWTKAGIERLVKAIETEPDERKSEMVETLLERAEKCMHYAVTIIQTARDDDTGSETVIEIAQELEAWAIAYLTAAMSIMVGRDLPETTEDINSMLYIYRGLYNQD